MPLQTAIGVSGGSSQNKSGGGIADTLLNLVDPAHLRTQISGLFSGGAKSPSTKGGAPGVNTPNSKTGVAPTDWRVKISLPPKSPIFYNNKSNQIQQVLAATNGVTFPYTPSITVTHSARYSEQALTHSNYKNYFYEGSDIQAITITGDFTVQNRAEGLYLLAAIYFFRSCTKMFFGTDSLAGNPPPIVYLDGYGDFYFPHVTCVVTSFQHTMPTDVDYLEIPYSESTSASQSSGKPPGTSQLITRLPTSSQLTVTVQPVYSRSNVHNNMNLTDFSAGHLLSGKGGFI